MMATFGNPTPEQRLQILRSYGEQSDRLGKVRTSP